MTATTTPLSGMELEILKTLAADREYHYGERAAAEIRALRAERDDLLAVARMVAAQYEREQHQIATGHHLPADGATWLTVDHTVGQAARAAIDRAEGRAEG